MAGPGASVPEVTAAIRPAEQRPRAPTPRRRRNWPAPPGPRCRRHAGRYAAGTRTPHDRRGPRGPSAPSIRSLPSPAPAAAGVVAAPATLPAWLCPAARTPPGSSSGRSASSPQTASRTARPVGTFAGASAPSAPTPPSRTGPKPPGGKVRATPAGSPRAAALADSGRFKELARGRKELKGPAPEEARVFLGGRLLGAARKAAGRANRRVREAPKGIYGAGTTGHVEGRPALARQREQRAPKRRQTVETRHRARSKAGALH